MSHQPAEPAAASPFAFAIVLREASSWPTACKNRTSAKRCRMSPFQMWNIELPVSYFIFILEQFNHRRIFVVIIFTMYNKLLISYLKYYFPEKA